MEHFLLFFSKHIDDLNLLPWTVTHKGHKLTVDRSGDDRKFFSYFDNQPMAEYLYQDPNFSKLTFVNLKTT